MFRLNHRSIKVTLFSEIHIKIISKISLTYHQIAFSLILLYEEPIYDICIYHKSYPEVQVKKNSEN